MLIASGVTRWLWFRPFGCWFSFLLFGVASPPVLDSRQDSPHTFNVRITPKTNDNPAHFCYRWNGNFLSKNVTVQTGEADAQLLSCFAGGVSVHVSGFDLYQIHSEKAIKQCQSGQHRNRTFPLLATVACNMAQPRTLWRLTCGTQQRRHRRLAKCQPTCHRPHFTPAGRPFANSDVWLVTQKPS